MTYSETTKKDALRLYMDRVPMTEIASRESMPARATLYRWAEEGEATDGQPWEDYRRDHETAVVHEAIDEDSGQWSKMASDIDEVIRVTFDRLKSGKMTVRAKDLDHLLTTKAKIEKRQREHEKEDWRAEVFCAVFKDLYRCVLEECGEDTAMAVVGRFEELDGVTRDLMEQHEVAA